MGNLHAMEFADAVEGGSIPLAFAIEWNLRSNHFPPLPSDYVSPIMEAIDAVKEGDPDRDIKLPEHINPVPRESDGFTVKASTLLRITHSENFVNSIWEE